MSADPWVRQIVSDIMDRPGDERFREMTRFLQWSLAAYSSIRRKMLRDMPDPPKVRYGSAEEMVIFNGRPVATRITDCALPPMRPGNCFGNALEVTLADPSYTYVEGWACMEHSFPTHHAWLEDANGAVHDPTWLPLVRQWQQEDTKRKLAPDYDARCVYLGVRLARPNHLAWFEKHGTPNLLAFGEMTPREVLHDGMDAFADAIIPELMDTVIGLTRHAIATHAPWMLMADGTGYERTRPDGTREEWRP